MIEVGRLCVKTAGRDAGLKCVVVEVLDKNFVLIDGQTRRRKCNILHLEPLDEKIDINPDASHDEIAEEFGKIGIEIRETKPKKAEARPRKTRKREEKPAEAEELSKKIEKEVKKEKEGAKPKEAKKEKLKKEKEKPKK